MNWIDLSHYGLSLAMIEVEQDGKVLPGRMVMAVVNAPELADITGTAGLLSSLGFKQSPRKPHLWSVAQDEFRMPRMLEVFPEAQAADVAEENVVRRIKTVAPVVPVPAPSSHQEMVSPSSETTQPLAEPVTVVAPKAEPAGQAVSTATTGGDLFTPAQTPEFADGETSRIYYGTFSSHDLPDDAALIYSYKEVKTWNNSDPEEFYYELFETSTNQRFLRRTSPSHPIQYPTVVAVENPNLNASYEQSRFLRLEPRAQNLNFLVSILIEEALRNNTPIRGGDLDQFARVVFGPDHVAEGMAAINRQIPGTLLDIKIRNAPTARKPKSISDVYNMVAEASQLLVFGSSLPKSAAVAPLPVKVALQRLAITGKKTRDERISYFGDASLVSEIDDVRRLSELTSDDQVPITDNAILDLSGWSPVKEKTEVNGCPVSTEEEGNLLRVLGNRTENGRTQVVLQQSETTDALIRYVACRFAIEGRATIDPLLTGDNTVGAEQFYMLLVGKRRPAVLDEPHEAALRVKRISDWASLWSWTSTVVSNRNKIDKYYEAAGAAGQDGLSNRATGEQNRFQVPYVSLSKISEPTTMLPRNMAAATRHALARVQQDIPDVDKFLSERLSMPLDQMAERLQPEQIDASVMILHAFSRGYAFLLGDQTGTGKGTSLMTVVSTFLNPDQNVPKMITKNGDPITKILVLTENATNIADLFRDIKRLDRLDWFQPGFINGEIEIKDEISGELISAGTPDEEVRQWVDAREWPAGKNIVFATYTQFNKATKKSRHALTTEETRRAGKAFWLEQVVDKNTLLITDEAQNALGLSSATGVNIRAAVEKAGLVVWSSGSHGKDSRSAHLYMKALPTWFDRDTVTEVLRKGGESMSEVFTSMLCREGTFLRREHDLSRCDYTVFEIDEARQEENRIHMDALAAVLSEIAYINGDVQQRVNALNVQIAQDLIREDPILAVNEDHLKSRFKSLQIKRQSFGSPLYNLSRIFVAALIVNDAVDKAVGKLREGRKPVLMVENTVENILRELIDPENQEPQVVEPPSFGIVIRRMIKNMIGWTDHRGNRHAVMDTDPEVMNNFVGLRIREVNHGLAEQLNELISRGGDEATKEWKRVIRAAYTREVERLERIGYLGAAGRRNALQFVRQISRAPIPGSSAEFQALVDIHFPIGGEERAVAFASALSRIEMMIDALPPLEASIIDSVRSGIEAAGFSCGEITGRKLMYSDGMVMRRPQSTRQEIRNAFNSGALDALLINAAGAVGIDLHAGERFADQRPRSMIPVQTPADPLTLIQGLGRIFRYRQTSRPEVLMPLTGLPIHARFIMMMNAKLGRVSATTTSNREHSAKITSVPDLFSSIGDIVCFNYFKQRPDLMLRMGFDVVEEENADQQNGQAEKDVASMIAFGEDGEEKRKANSFIGRLIMLGDAEQRQIWDDLCAEYDAYIQELDAMGKNPLKSQVIDGKVHLKDITPLSGDFRDLDRIADGEFTSEFAKPVFLQNVTIERKVQPVRSEQLEYAVAQGLISYEARQVALLVNKLVARREDNLGIWNTTDLPLDLALAQFEEQKIENVLTRHAQAYDRLVAAVSDILPGKKIVMSMDGVAIFGIATRLEPPIDYNSRSYADAHHWNVLIQIPGYAEALRFNLGSLIKDPNFKIEPGMESSKERKSLLDWFETAVNASRLESAQLLTGNLWEAMRLNLKFKLGKMVSWDDDNGIVHRGVLISKGMMNKDTLKNSLPTPIDDLNNVVITVDRKLKVFGSNYLDTNGLTVYRESGSFIVSLPYISNKEYAALWDNQAALQRLLDLSVPHASKPGRDNLTAWLNGQLKSAPSTKLTLVIPSRENLRAALETLSDTGIRFFGTAKAREFLAGQTVAAAQGRPVDRELIERRRPAGRFGRRAGAAAQIQPNQAPAAAPTRPALAQQPVMRVAAQAHAQVVRQPAEAPDVPPAPPARGQPEDGAEAPNPFGFRIIQRPAA